MTAMGRGLVQQVLGAAGAGGPGLAAEIEGIARYSGESMEMAGQTAAAAAAHVNDSATTLAPVVGPIGAGFLAAFAQAEASYLAGAGQVVATHAGMGIATAAAAADYVGGDAAAAADFTAIDPNGV